MPATGPGTTLGRIAELEERLAAALKCLDAISERLTALEAAQVPEAARKEINNTSATTETAWHPPHRAPAQAKAFGFGKP